MFFRDYAVTVTPETPTRAVITLNPEVGKPIRETIEQPPEFESLLGLLDGWIRSEMKGDQSNPEREAEKSRLGQQLYTTFFQGELAAAFQHHRNQQGGTRIKIQADPAAKDTHHWFFNMPWELMIAPGDGYPLCIAPDISFVRQMPGSSQTPTKAPQMLPHPLKILVLTANSPVMAKVDEDQFSQPILDSFAGNKRVEVEVVRSPTLLLLQDKLATFKPHILHITGHGGKPQGGRAGTEVENYNELGVFYIPKGGGSENSVIGPFELMSILKPSLSHLRMVTLASCNLGRSSQRGFEDGFAAHLCAGGVPAVVAFQFELSFKAATLWLHTFYRSLAQGHRLDSAMTDARSAMNSLLSAGRRRDLEYGSPMLFSRLADGRLFRHEQVVKIISRADETLDIPGIDEDVVDLTAYFKGAGLKEPTLVDDAGWNTHLYPRLMQLKSTLNERMKISITGKMHLSIMAAVGFLFNETCGCQLEYEQVNRHTHAREVWTSFVKPESLPMQVTFEEGDPHASDLIACVSVSNPTLDDAQRCFSKAFGKPYRGLLHCKPKAGTGSNSIPNDSAALALARAFGDEIKQAAQRIDAARVHLFISAPLGFALFLGMQLNGCRPVQLYEYARPDYQPSILLR